MATKNSTPDLSEKEIPLSQEEYANVNTSTLIESFRQTSKLFDALELKLTSSVEEKLDAQDAANRSEQELALLEAKANKLVGLVFSQQGKRQPRGKDAIDKAIELLESASR